VELKYKQPEVGNLFLNIGFATGNRGDEIPGKGYNYLVGPEQPNKSIFNGVFREPIACAVHQITEANAQNPVYR